MKRRADDWGERPRDRRRDDRRHAHTKLTIVYPCDARITFGCADANVICIDAYSPRRADAEAPSTELICPASTGA